MTAGNADAGGKAGVSAKHGPSGTYGQHSHARQDPQPRFVVVCTRHDGRERRWCAYADRDEAERVAAHLTAIGCPARVATDDQLLIGEGPR